MFCEKCGKELNEEFNCCPSCGNCNKGVNQTDLKKVISKNQGILGIILIAGLLLIFVFRGSGVNFSPIKVAEAALKSEYGADVNLMVKCFPPFTLRELASEYNLPQDATRREIANKLAEDYMYQSSKKVEIRRSTVVETFSFEEYNRVYREIENLFADEYGAIKEFAIVELDYYVEGEGEDTIRVHCIKMKNKWYLLRT